MPFVNMKIAGAAPSVEQIERLHSGITLLMAEVLVKDATLTGVLVEHVVAGAWAIGGERAARAAHVEATISAGTNTPEQKSRFLAALDDFLRQVLGTDLPMVTYIVIHEVPKDSWGFGGVTQAARAGLAA